MKCIYLQHTRDNVRITCHSWTQALNIFYRQWWDPDGSIPWVIVSDGQVITEEDLRT
jgi:hypothetical protein